MRNMKICVSFELWRIITAPLIKGFVRSLSMSPRHTPTFEENIIFIIF